MKWSIKKIKNLQLSNPIFIEGLPGIGNVGKIAIDILVEEIKGQKVYELFSHQLPNSVFVNEKNMVELPKIEIFYKKIKNKDFLFLTGDSQPVTEESSYEFAETILNLVQRFRVREIITLGGIGLNEIPKNPKVYCTGNSRELMNDFKKFNARTNVYGVIGPIVGISGLLLGLSQRRNIKAVSLLSETYGHPMYIGLRGAKEVLKILNSRYGFSISLKNLDKEIKSFEEDMSFQEPGNLPERARHISKYKKFTDTSYIG